jgi:hypothetical protein
MSVAAWVKKFAKLIAVRKTGLRKLKRIARTKKPRIAGGTEKPAP